MYILLHAGNINITFIEFVYKSYERNSTTCCRYFIGNIGAESLKQLFDKMAREKNRQIQSDTRAKYQSVRARIHTCTERSAVL